MIHQSVDVPPGARREAPRPGGSRRDRSRRTFDVCVLAHLRAVKDPLRAALAVRDLPPDSRVRIVHLGRALDPALAARARREMQRNPRYHWLGEWPRHRALHRLARSR